VIPFIAPTVRGGIVFRGGIVAVVTIDGAASAADATVVSVHRKMTIARRVAAQLRADGIAAAAEWADEFIDAGGTLPSPPKCRCWSADAIGNSPSNYCPVRGHSARRI
jgi:hypothetical protein